MCNSITKAQLAAFALQLQQQEKSPATAQKYTHDIGAFAQWLGHRPLTQQLATQYKALLIDRGAAPATVNAALSALNRFFAFLGRGDCHLRHMRVQRQVFRDPQRELTSAEYRRLIAAANRQHRPLLALLVETLCSTGMRVSEVQFITPQAVRQGKVEIYLKGKVRVILLPSRLCRKLQPLLSRQNTGPLFCTKTGRPLTRQQIWAQLKSLCAAAGVDRQKVFPHNLRHLFAVVFYRSCRDIAKLADLLGHSNIQTTRIYLVSSGAEHRRQLDQLHLVI